MRVRFGLTTLLMAACALLGSASADCQEGRDFSGFYDLKDVVDLGEEVAVTLVVEIFNYGEVDAYDAVLMVEDPLDMDGTQDSLWVGFIGARDRGLATDELTVPAWDYELWVTGLLPGVRIEFDDADGVTHVARPELIWAPQLEDTQ